MQNFTHQLWISPRIFQVSNMFNFGENENQNNETYNAWQY